MNKKLVSVIMSGILSISAVTQFGLSYSNAYTSYERIGGKNRYYTSYMVSDRNHSDTVILASGESYPDALSAVNLSNKFDAATILTNGNLDVVNVIKKRGAKKVFLVGGVRSISNKLENKLKEEGLSVERIGGINRYETSINTIKKAGYTSVGVCSGQNYIDALAASALLKQENAGLLLVEGTKPYKVPANTTVKYTFGGVKSVVQNGGERISGISRYATAVEIANKVKDPNALAIVSGSNYPDALSATNLVVSDGAVIMPVDNVPYYDVIKKAKSVNKLFVVGGNKSVSDETMNYVLSKAKDENYVANSDIPNLDSSLTKEQEAFLNDLNRVGNNVVTGINRVNDIVAKIKGIRLPNISKPLLPLDDIGKLVDGLKSKDISSLISNIDKVNSLINSLKNSNLSNIKNNISKIKDIRAKVEMIKSKIDALNKQIDSTLNNVTEKIVRDALTSIKNSLNDRLKELINNMNNNLPSNLTGSESETPKPNTESGSEISQPSTTTNSDTSQPNTTMNNNSQPGNTTNLGSENTNKPVVNNV